MEKKAFRKRIITPKHVSIAVCLLLIFGLLYLNDVPWYVYIIILICILPAFKPYQIDGKYLTQGNFVAIPVESMDKVFVKESGSVVIYYSKPYKDKEYTNTVYPVDSEGFVDALQQLNEEMTILRENS